jgi:hypothetical protein
MNAGRAYREFRVENPDAPWNPAALFDAISDLGKTKGIEAGLQPNPRH